MGLNYIQATENMWGAGGASTDTLNRALRTLLSDSGHDPDASPFPGIIPVFNIKPYVAASAGVATTGIAAAATAAGVKGIFFPPGTTDVLTNLTISVPVQFAPGAIVRPANGVTVTFTGHIEAGHRKIFDVSLGGLIRFTGNRQMSGYKLLWFGLKRDGTDDHAAIQACIDAVPNSSTIIVPDNFGEACVASELVFYNRNDVKLVANADTRQFADSSIKYIGPTKAPVQANFTPTASTLHSVTIAGTPWAADQFAGAYMEVVSGKGAGQTRWILDNTNNTASWGVKNDDSASDVGLNLDVALDGTSVVRIVEPSPIVGMYWSQFCEIRGFYLKPNALADVCVNMDSPVRGTYTSPGGGAIGTSCKVRYCTMEAAPTKQHGTCIAITLQKGANQEYHVFEHNIMAGGAFPSGNKRYFFNLGTTAASTTVTGSGFNGGGGAAPVVAGQVIRIADAGPNSYRSFNHRAVVVSVTDDTHLVISAPATRTAAAKYGIIGQGNGYGVWIGRNPNAKRIKTFDNRMYGLYGAITVMNGSFNSELDSFTDDEAIILRYASSDPCTMEAGNAELCQHLLINAGFATTPLDIQGRFDVSSVPPNECFVDSETIQAPIALGVSQFENRPTQPGMIFSGWGPGNTFTIRQCTFAQFTTYKELLGDNIPDPAVTPIWVTIDRCINLKQWDGTTDFPKYFFAGPSNNAALAATWVGDTRSINGYQRLSAPLIHVANGAPTDADIGNNEMQISVDEAGNLLKFRVRYSTGALKSASVALV